MLEALVDILIIWPVTSQISLSADADVDVDVEGVQSVQSNSDAEFISDTLTDKVTVNNIYQLYWAHSDKQYFRGQPTIHILNFSRIKEH